MTNALLRTPKGFFTSFGGGGDGTLPIHFSQLKMTAARKRNGGWLWASFNGGLLKTSTLPAKAEAERNCGGNRLDEGPQGSPGLPDDENFLLEHYFTFDYLTGRPLDADKRVVNIWWDFGRCPLPLKFDPCKIASNINKALRCLNIAGDLICIKWYGSGSASITIFMHKLIESGFLTRGYGYYRRRPNATFINDLQYHSNLRTAFSLPSAINIVISDGSGYPNYSLDSLRKDGNIIIPFEILLDEGPQVGGFPDDENPFLEHYLEFEYPVGRPSPDYERSVNIWWDAGRCPPPLNFDISKIGITVVEVMRLFNTSLPIYLRVYGNRLKLLPEMAIDTKRIISESGFKLAGFKLKDDDSGFNVSDFLLEGFLRNRKYFSPVFEENLMLEDLIYYGIHNGAPPQAIHMVVLDGKVITATVLDQLHGRRSCHCLVIGLEPKEEVVDGVWRWKPLPLSMA